jgi:hypothetical protein
MWLFSAPIVSLTLTAGNYTADAAMTQEASIHSRTVTLIENTLNPLRCVARGGYPAPDLMVSGTRGVWLQWDVLIYILKVKDIIYGHNIIGYHISHEIQELLVILVTHFMVLIKCTHSQSHACFTHVYNVVGIIPVDIFKYIIHNIGYWSFIIWCKRKVGYLVKDILVSLHYIYII